LSASRIILTTELLSANNSSEIIKREMATLKELLELEPGAKWPLDTLVHYALLLLKTGAPEAEEEALLVEVEDWLKQLEQVDPGRKERYRDIWSGVQARNAPQQSK
jgi:hypothetical protein